MIRLLEVLKFSIEFSHGLDNSQFTIQLVCVFQHVWKLKYNIKVTTYSMLLPDVGIVKILLSCFTIPIATIFIATFIRDSLIAFVEFHFSKVTGTFWHWSNILERRLKSVYGNLEKKVDIQFDFEHHVLHNLKTSQNGVKFFLQ